MPKLRVGDAAKELNLKVADALARLREMGVSVKSNLSMIDESTVARLRAAAAGDKTVAAQGKAATGAKQRGSTSAAGRGKSSGSRAGAVSGKSTAAKTRAAKPSGASSVAAKKSPAAPGKGTAESARPIPARRSPEATRPKTTTVPAAATRGPGVVRQPVSRSASAASAVRGGIAGQRPAGIQQRVPSTTARPATTGTGSIPAGIRQPVTGVRTPITGARPPLHGVRPAAAPGTRAPGAGVRPQGTGARAAVPGVRPADPGAPRPAGTGAPRAAQSSPGVTPAAGAMPGVRPTSAPPRPRLAPGAPARPPIGKGPQARPAAGPRPVGPPRPEAPPPLPPIPEVLQDITINEGVTVKELSEKMNRKAKDLITRLLAEGFLATMNQPLDSERAITLCREFGFDAKVVSFEEEVAREHAETVVTANLQPRYPIVTIMGHVDHGKTSLLDAIRESNVVAREAGGITQHIGAYHITYKKRGITFIDTPGHEAFTMMRARGARVTDIVILVVAADDGVMPQTKEAIDHARAAGVPMIVAINKVDKPGANLDRVKKQLGDQDLLVEDWGGKIVAVPISAKQKTGIEDLLEMILLTADLADLKADPTSHAAGTVLEAKLDKTRGPVATVLIQRGTLRVGDPFIAGAVHGKVRAMFDEKAQRSREAGPSIPVEVLGLEGVPRAGDLFQVLEEEWRVRQIGAYRQQKLRRETMAKTSRLTLDHLHDQIKEGMVKELALIVKADVHGSVEALSKSLEALPSERVKIKVIHAGSGAITETDVLLASASNAIIIGYNVRPERSAQDLAEKEKVDIRLHAVIYDITNEIKNAMVGLLEPESKEVYLGRAEVRQSFKVPKIGLIAGCMVADGLLNRSGDVRLLRDNVVIHTGKISSLRRFKNDASEVKAGYECGIGLANFNDIKVGDVIEAFRVEKVAAKSL